MSSIKSLVVDWISGNLFWTDLMQAKIKVSNSNGSISADLVSDGLKSPSGIAIDPVKGWVGLTHIYLVTYVTVVFEVVKVRENCQKNLPTFRGKTLRQEGYLRLLTS